MYDSRTTFLGRRNCKNTKMYYFFASSTNFSCFPVMITSFQSVMIFWKVCEIADNRCSMLCNFWNHHSHELQFYLHAKRFCISIFFLLDYVLLTVTEQSLLGFDHILFLFSLCHLIFLAWVSPTINFISCQYSSSGH